MVVGKIIRNMMSMDSEMAREERMIRRNSIPGIISKIVLLCASCRKLRNDSGGWEQNDRFIETYSAEYLSHGMCPQCTELQFPDEYAAICLEKKIEASW